MTVAANDLARITVDTPDRRIDIAAPAAVPLSDLIGVLVRGGGERLAERGAATGWVLRRGDGSALSGAQSLNDQGVRDGDRLHLVPADEGWPELEYDDIAEAIASTRRDGSVWHREATRRAGIGVGTGALLLALFAIVRSQPHGTVALLAAGIAAIEFGAGVLVSRSFGDVRAGVAVTALAGPFAFIAVLLARGGRPYALDLLAACVTVAVLAWLGALAVGRTSAVFDALCSAGLLGAAAAELDRLTTPVDAAAVTLATIALAAGLIPPIAVRLGRLDGLDVGALARAVERSDTAVVGLCCGAAVVGAIASGVLGASGQIWPRVLTLAAAVALTMRARSYPSLRQRSAALSIAAALLLPLVASLLWRGDDPAALIAALAVGGGLSIMLSTVAHPDASRVASWLEALSLLSILPLMAGALNLYARAKALR
jgi:type VII secretion integral membrane protein EccD